MTNRDVETNASALRTFCNAITAGDDEATEQSIAQLSPADEPDLLSLVEPGGTSESASKNALKSASEKAEVRWWAVRALAEHGSHASLAALRKALHDDDPATRAAAAMALATVQRRHDEMLSEDAFTEMADLLCDADGLVRQSVADALAQCGDPAVPALAAVLDGTHDGARSRAAYALHKIKTIKAAPVLYQHLNDRNYLVRTHCHDALDEMGLLENILVTL